MSEDEMGEPDDVFLGAGCANFANVPGKVREIDLLLLPLTTNTWLPRRVLGNNSWKIYSGRWQKDDSGRVLYLPQHEVRTGENIAIVGSVGWENYRIEISVNVLTESVRPPEGGAILYHHFQNMRNYRSLHLCIFKKHAEIIDRIHGAWSTVAVQHYDFERGKSYNLAICSTAGRSCYFLEGRRLLETRKDILRHGCFGIGAKFCEIAVDHATILFAEQPGAC